ncbi:MFS transporter [Amycolatopsis pigmentata]|uniref:MFS transporter n=1 Tax=Amycolatopsis pigmentata TaxID=450801 RepID=A0ABW5G2D2_9PSEU
MTPLVAGALLNPINTTLIAVALIPIGRTFGAGPEKTAWLLTALYLATAVGQPVIGLFVDRFGPRRVLLAGAVTVIVAGVAGTFAFSLGWLVAVRVVLGVGTCAGFPAAMAVLRKRADATGSGVPSRVLSILAMSGQTIMVIGPALGGALIGLAGWSAIFAVNIPLGLASVVLTLLWIPKDDRAGLKRERIDVAGIVLFSATLLALLLFVMKPAVSDLWLLAVTAGLGAVFVRVETRSAKPFVDLRMLAGNRPLLRTYLRQALAFLIVYSIMFGYVQWLESARGLSESGAGAVLLPMSAVAVLATAFSGKPSGIKARLIGNSLALLGGAALLLFVDPKSWLGELVAIAAVFGLGQGLTSVTNQTALYGQAPAGQIGTASGLFRTAQYLGAIAASTLIALCFGTQATSSGLHKLSLALLGVGMVLLVVTVADRALGASRRTPEQAR